MHWADVEAQKLEERALIAIGVAPSGPIHIGFLRELFTAEALARTSNGKLLLIVDSMDPLRKLYPFLDESYEEQIGKPLSEIPCICGEHRSYSEHFLQSFLDTVDEMGVDLEVKYAHKMYADGEYEEATRIIINKRKKVASIIEEHTGRELPDDWYPYNPICSQCGRLGTSTVLKFEDPYVYYECDCGNEDKADIRTDDGKLPWRCDWPARWWILDIDCEPFGKDHAASGGSWDTGKAIIEDVLESNSPHPVLYEWIHLKGKGPMSSSTGVAIKSEDMLKIVGPEVIRFLIMRPKPSTHIDFDPGLGVLDLVDEYDNYEQKYFEEEDEDMKRVYELSQVDKPPKNKPERVPYRHLVNLIQIYDDFDKIWKVVQDTDQIDTPSDEDYRLNKERAKNVEYWLENFAPDFVKFSIKKELPEISVSEDEKKFLKIYHEKMKDIIWNPENLHQLVHEGADEIDINKGKAFRVFYKILLGKNKGPRLGRFLSQLDRGFVKERIEDVLSD